MIRTLLVASVAWSSATSVQGPGAFVSGFAEGLLGDSTEVQACGHDLHGVAGAGMHLVEDLAKRNVTKIVGDIESLLRAFQGSMHDCKAAAGELKPFLHIMDGVHNPGDLYHKLKENFLHNDEDVIDAFEGAGKYCTFAEPNGHKCGLSLGRPIRIILIGEPAFQLDARGPGAFVEGFAQGLFGENPEVGECVQDAKGVAGAGAHLVGDLKARNISKVVVDFGDLLHAFQGSIRDCKAASAAFTPFLHILDGVKTPADLYHKMKANFLQYDEDVIDAFEGAGKYCTFAEPNGHKCGESLGRPMRIILIGEPSMRLAVQGPGAFFSGFAEGLIGNPTDVEACGHDLGGVAGAGVHLIHDLAKFNIEKVVQDVQDMLHAFTSSIHDCKTAIADLAPFLHIMDGVHGPGDLYRKLKGNFLNNDEAIVDAFEGAGKHCTFAEPNAHKCGESLGSPIRLILIGASEALVVV